jgi:hypothetical protein
VALLSVGGAGLITGGVFAWQTGVARKALDGACVAQDDGLLCPGSASADNSRYKTNGMVRNISLAAGGTLVVAGIIAAVIPGKKSASDLEIVPTAGPQGGGLVLSARFE